MYVCMLMKQKLKNSFERYPALTFERFHGYVMNVLEDSKVSKLTAIQKGIGTSGNL